MRGPTSSLKVAGQTAGARETLSLRATLRWPVVVAAAALSLLLAVGVSAALHSAPRRVLAPAHTSRAAAASHKDLSTLPLGAQGPISAALGKDDRAYHVSGSAGSLRASNPSQRLAVGFGPKGVSVSTRGAQLGMALSAIGYGSTLSPVGSASPSASANRVQYAYPNVQAWYANGPVGLEQGFTVTRAPAGAASGPLTISLALSGNTRARLAKDGRSITLSRAGTPAFTYGGLSATDANGRVLHSSLELRGASVLLSVDASGARYPIKVDPFIQQGEKLVGTGSIGTAFQGFSVSLSGEGTTAIVGGPEDKGDSGAAWVFTRSGTTWSQQTKLVPTGANGKAEFGTSVALDANGSIAIVGAPDDAANNGASWVFTRSGTTWSQQAKLVGSGVEGEAEQGTSVAISSEGNTVLIGGMADNGGQGATWVFTRTESTWTQQGEKLVGSGSVGAPEEGASVALSAEGTTALIGGPGDGEGLGAAWVFTRSGTTWTQQGEKLVGTGNEGEARQGTSVALSSKGGNFAILGGPENASGAGAAWVFSRSESKWTQQTKLTGTGASGAAHQGHSVALNSEGTTALLGGPNDNENAGAVWAFTRSGSTWTQQGSKLSGTGATGKPMQGLSVSIAGENALWGGPEDNTNAGAAWVFTRSAGKWTQQGSKLVGTGALGNAFQGFSVAVSSEGTTAIVGGPTDGGAAGAAWVFTRSGTTWSQQAKLVGTGAVGLATQGFSVAIASNGSTALVGGPSDSEFAGATWVFTRSGTTWSQQGSKLVGTGATGFAEQGFSVALNAEGNTALIGGFEDNEDTGAAWVFTRSGTTWSQQGSKLVGTGATGAAEQGFDVSLNSEGNTALIGGPADAEFTGAAWVFTRSGTTWSQQGSKLVGSGADFAQEGISVALSGEGNTALIGGPADTDFTGAAWVFQRSGSTWTQQGEKLVGSGAVGPAAQGHDVALSSNGNIALLGGPFDEEDVGAAWVFDRSGSTWAQAGPKLRGTNAVGAAQEGLAVALASNGSTAIIGAPEDNSGAGAVWPFALANTAPGVVTKPATSITPTTATLNATVAPDGAEVTKCTFEYGETTGYGTKKPCSPSPTGSGEVPQVVTAALEGLTASTVYHFRIVATNSIGTSNGADATFKSAGAPPTLKIEKATGIGQTGATLNATINPNGSEVTTCTFEYGETTSYGKMASCPSAPGLGESAVPESAAVEGLTASTTYHFRIVAVNGGGKSESADETFTTASAPVPPAVVTQAASSVGTRKATLNGTVNPNGFNVTKCEFEWGTTTAYGSLAPCTALPGAGTSSVAVTAIITGLTPATTYHFRLAAMNSGGTTMGEDQSFTTLAAQNEPHYFVNGTGNANRIGEGEKTPIISWGTLTLSNTKGGTGAKVTCRGVLGGYVENPGEGATGAAGIGDTQTLGSYECESPQCTPAATGGGAETYASLAAEASVPAGGSLTDLRWLSELVTEGSLIRSEMHGVSLSLICHVQMGATFKNTIEKYEGALKPQAGPIRNKAVAPPEFSFEAGSGVIHGPGAEASREGTIEGALKILGYAEQGIVNAKVG